MRRLLMTCELQLLFVGGSIGKVAVLGGYLDDIALLVLFVEQIESQVVFDGILDQATQRPDAVMGIIAIVQQVLLGCGG